jgi:hypothetical protein
VVEIVRRDRREGKLERRKAAVHQQEHAEHLADSVPVDSVIADQRAGEAPTVEQVEEGEHDAGHRDQAVIAGIEHADDEEGRRPGDQLAGDLAARAPDHRPLHLVGKACPERRRRRRRRGGGFHVLDSVRFGHVRPVAPSLRIRFPGPKAKGLSAR